MNSFYPHSVKIWNVIGPELRQAPSLSIFKSKILKLIRPLKNTMYDIHDPKGVKRLFQLRVGLSSLKNHKKRHNFKDTLSDVCRCQTHAETTDHFLLNCNLYTEIRNDMFQVENPILEASGLRVHNNTQFVKLLIYGHENLCEADNITVLSETLKYMHKSTRNWNNLFKPLGS